MTMSRDPGSRDQGSRDEEFETEHDVSTETAHLAPGTVTPGTTKIRIAHSPDSDDAFMFYGLASGHVPSNGFELEHVLSDIETLNQAAFVGKYEISAVSFHAYAHLTDKYMLLPH